jgi:para-nitrobenzyl esterase
VTDTSAPSTAELRRFETEAGQIVGRADDDVVRVLGIPYAVAGRFEPPRAIPRWSEPFEAFTRSPASPQQSSPVLDSVIQDANHGMTYSEHCQSLSVTLPEDATSADRLPVMVWIHGGAHVTGGGDLDIYDPRAIVAEQRVIVVAITFRLGILGYLGTSPVPANLGLLDQLAALRWVHDNIAAFGGDPDSITLFGQSSGGDSIASLMISDGASGLFRRAIVQSAPLGIMTKKSRMTRAMARVVGPLSATAPIAELLALQKHAERAASRFGLRGGLPFGPEFGHAPLPDEADSDRAWRAIAPDIDLLIGSTAEETALYLPVLPVVGRLAPYPRIRKVLRHALILPTTRIVYGREARRFADRHRTAGGRAALYQLTWAPEESPVGAAHASDLPLLLGSEAAWSRTALVGAHNWPEIDRRGKTLRRVWADFARSGTVGADARKAASATMRFHLG